MPSTEESGTFEQEEIVLQWLCDYFWPLFEDFGRNSDYCEPYRIIIGKHADRYRVEGAWAAGYKGVVWVPCGYIAERIQCNAKEVAERVIQGKKKRRELPREALPTGNCLERHFLNCIERHLI